MRLPVPPPSFRIIMAGWSRLLRCDTGGRRATIFSPPRWTGYDSRVVVLSLNWTPSSASYPTSSCSEFSQAKDLLRVEPSDCVPPRPFRGPRDFCCLEQVSQPLRGPLWPHDEANDKSDDSVVQWTRLALNRLHDLPLHALPNYHSIAYNFDGRDFYVLRGSAFETCRRYWSQTCRAQVNRVCFNASHSDYSFHSTR